MLSFTERYAIARKKALDELADIRFAHKKGTLGFFWEEPGMIYKHIPLNQAVKHYQRKMVELRILKARLTSLGCK